MGADNEEFQIYVPLNTLAATESAIRYWINRNTEPVEVKSIEFLPNIAVTANDTNYRNFAGSVGGTALFTTIGTTTTGTGSLVAGTTYPFTLLATAAAVTARRIAAGATLLLSATHAASGVAIDGQFVVTFRRVRVM